MAAMSALGTAASQPEHEQDVARDVFIARQPIFDSQRRVYGYELLFRDGWENACTAANLTDAAGDVLQSAWFTFGFERLVGGRRAFTNLTRGLLVRGYGETLPVHATVVELMETVEGDVAVIDACRRLKQQGYLLALDDFLYRPALDRLIPLADIVKIDVSREDAADQVDHVRRISAIPRLLAEQVETHDAYRSATALGCHYFQGYFFCHPQVMQARTLNGVRLTSLKLLQCVTRTELVLEEVEATIRSDVSAAHRLLAYVGSFAFGFRAEVRSIHHALVLMGKHQIRRWVSLMALGEMGHDKPPELLMQAAVRGKFCECLSQDVGLGHRAPELFLVGTLSLLDAMLDAPMAPLLDQLPLAGDVRDALLDRPSPLRHVLTYVQRYERGNWTACALLGRNLGLTEATASKRYQEAVAWATTVLTDGTRNAH